MSNDTYIDWCMEKRKLQQKIEKLEASNAELLDELENQQKECWFYRMIDDCSTCRRRKICNLYKVINKAKGVQG